MTQPREAIFQRIIRETASESDVRISLFIDRMMEALYKRSSYHDDVYRGDPYMARLLCAAGEIYNLKSPGLDHTSKAREDVRKILAAIFWQDTSEQVAQTNPELLQERTVDYYESAPAMLANRVLKILKEKREALLQPSRSR